MKILNICMGAPFTEGYSYQDNLLSEYQHKLGHEVTVLTGIRTRDTNGKIVKTSPCDKILDNGVRLIRIDNGGKFKQFIGYNPQISEIINNVIPNMIFVHGLCSFVPAQAISYKKKHNDVFLVADNHQDERNTKLSSFPFVIAMFVWRWCWRRWIKNFNCIYGTTSWRKDFVTTHYGIPKEKTDTLVLGVNPDIIPKDKIVLRKEVRDELGYSDENFVFISGGKLNSQKRTIDVMRAFSKCNYTNIRFLIFGSISDDIKDEFYQLLNADNRIKYLGFIESKVVNRYFFASDFGVFPASHSVLWEEAIGCELPCLFGKFGDHDHLQVCENCVQLEQNASVDDLLVIMDEVITNTDYYKKLKDNAIKAAPMFSYYDIAKKSVQTID